MHGTAYVHFVSRLITNYKRITEFVTATRCCGKGVRVNSTK